MRPPLLSLFVLFSVLFSTQSRAADVGRLSVDSTPSSAVSVDGKAIGRTPLKRLMVTPGSHRIQLENTKAGSSTEFGVSVGAGRHMTCTYRFETGENRCAEEATKAREQKARITITSTPSADVYLDGRKIGTTPIDQRAVSAGRHSLEFHSEGVEPVTREVDVEAGQHVTVTVEIQAPKPKE